MCPRIEVVAVREVAVAAARWRLAQGVGVCRRSHEDCCSAVVVLLASRCSRVVMSPSTRPNQKLQVLDPKAAKNLYFPGGQWDESAQ